MYTRERWVARDANVARMATQGTPREAFIHHSEDTNGHVYNTFVKQAAKMRDIQRFHMTGRGWSDIGYHYVVFQYVGGHVEARVFQARLVKYVPAAQLDHNTDTLAICVVGDGSREHLERSTRYAIEELIREYPTVQKIGGHRDVTATECPGDKFYSDIPRIAHALELPHY